jgi:hypothetical protein
LKERFGEKGEGSRRSRQEEGSLEETDESVRISTINEEEYSARTPEEIMRESEPTTLKYVRLHRDINVAQKTNEIPHIK